MMSNLHSSAVFPPLALQKKQACATCATTRTLHKHKGKCADILTHKHACAHTQGEHSRSSEVGQDVCSKNNVHYHAHGLDAGVVWQPKADLHGHRPSIVQHHCHDHHLPPASTCTRQERTQADVLFEVMHCRHCARRAHTALAGGSLSGTTLLA